MNTHPDEIKWNGVDYVRKDLIASEVERVIEERIKELMPSNEKIHEAAKEWAREYSEAPDKDCPDWLIQDFEGGACFVRQCFGCLNKTDNHN